jgi:hypothetical protein
MGLSLPWAVATLDHDETIYDFRLGTPLGEATYQDG